MEIEKAIERLQMNNGSLKSLLSNDETDKDLLEKIEANNLAIRALEKQVGKKPNKDDCCPDCDTYLKDDNGVEGLYCPNCGRKIDWGDEQ